MCFKIVEYCPSCQKPTGEVGEYDCEMGRCSENNIKIILMALVDQDAMVINQDPARRDKGKSVASDGADADDVVYARGHVADTGGVNDEGDTPLGSSKLSKAKSRALERKSTPQTPDQARSRSIVYSEDIGEADKSRIARLVKGIRARFAAIPPIDPKDLGVSRPATRWFREEDELLWFLRVDLNFPFKQIQESYITGRTVAAIEHRHMFQRRGRVKGYPPQSVFQKSSAGKSEQNVSQKNTPENNASEKNALEENCPDQGKGNPPRQDQGEFPQQG
ncbi:hypothetical protein B0H66DRAFT_632324 [Apodospora peruviana]|uniref:Uncharacterized protein n=1 Tax=Apodospora peruviana TaxID=516989 RepID=A0AAE0HUP5_9PEZI|nr:hypothetical protein B0H66DRAFT_632324 [Apodospora peruviana]